MYKFLDRKSTRLNSSHITRSRMPSSAWRNFKIFCPLGYLLSFSEHPNSYLFPCGYFWCYDEIVLEVHIYPFKIKLSFVLCFKQWSYWYIYDFLLVIMYFTVVSILCVHVSLWTYIFMNDVYLETYTHENSYMFIGIPSC